MVADFGPDVLLGAIDPTAGLVTLLRAATARKWRGDEESNSEEHG